MKNIVSRFYNRLFADSIPLPAALPPKPPKGTVALWWASAKEAVSGFSDDRCLKLSASLAYYTIFSLAPLLVLIMALVSFFMGQDAINGKVFSQINGLVGDAAATQIQDMIQAAQISGQTPMAFGISLATVLVGATGLFAELQDSLNMIWQVKVKPQKGWLQLIKDRFLSASLILSLAFLLLVSLLINSLVGVLGDELGRWLPGVSTTLISVVNFVVGFGVVVLFFASIFKILPNLKLTWRNVWAGAIFTTLLFSIGRYLIELYITKTAPGSVYGAAGSLIVILIWIYYTSAILYLGAEFTKAYAHATDSHIEPDDNAVYVERIEKPQPAEDVQTGPKPQ